MPEQSRQMYLELLDCLIVCRCEPSEDTWHQLVSPVVAALCQASTGKLPKSKDAEAFLLWDNNAVANGQQTRLRTQSNLFRYPSEEAKVSIRLSSIHRVEGETHTATLVLDSYHKTHHLKKLLPWLAGKRPRVGTDNTAEDAATVERLRLHYVAMTRPSHLLCLAMRKDAVSDAELDAIRARDWNVVLCMPLADASEPAEAAAATHAL